jgi:serine/threonine-protein kinase
MGEVARIHANTAVSERRSVSSDEHRTALIRLFGVGVVAWPLFLVVDSIPVLLAGTVRDLGWIVALRAFGEACALPAYFLIRYARRLSNWRMYAIDAAVFVLGSVLLALMGMPFGGIAGRLHQGLLIFIFVRCILLPMPWQKAFPVPMACAAAFPITLACASLVYPSIAAQWRDKIALAGFVHNTLLCFSAAAVGAFASHMIFVARRQVRETTKLGNYRLKARIGSGGVGEVWLARQLSLERDVALKVLREQSQRSEATIKRFVREARAASQLRHPNTIRIFDFGATEEGVLFIAMELLSGMDLDNLVEVSGPLAPSRVIHLARQVCGSLAEAHEHRFLHRDIKPANIFVAQMGDEYDLVKVLDFGVTHVEPTTGGSWGGSITETGALTGTPGYMSPEICGGSEAIDARTDIYSFGAAMYFMLTGTPLYPNKTLGEVVMMQISRMPERPSARLGAPVPHDLEDVVMKCLAKKPDDRYATIEDVERALAACADADHWTKADSRRAWAAAHGSAQLRTAVRA